MMDWIKLLTLLLTVTTPFICADGSRKKIRIHIPQKVKHIHHHKKIYITQHPATAQYAPAYLPTADGTVALPASVIPTLAGFKPLPMYEERRSGRHSKKSSPILPMYRARGFYGPQPSWEQSNFDIDFSPPPGHTGPSAPASFIDPHGLESSPEPVGKRIKVQKINQTPKKKRIIKRKKPKRIIIQELQKNENEPPVSSFHEQFYADVDTEGTIQKLKKPKRVEKIIDGDTEHIHTYTEEHIHKIVFDEPKIPALAEVESQTAGYPGVGNQGLLPFKNNQAILSLDSNLRHPGPHYGPKPIPNLRAVAPMGSLGTPTFLEYAGYNTRDVTHDHMYHDHGYVPSHIDLSGNNLGTPPKASYNSQGTLIGGTSMRQKNKNQWGIDNGIKTSRPGNEFAFYENMFNNQPSASKPKHPYQFQKPTNEQSLYGPTYDKPSFRQKQKNRGIINAPLRRPTQAGQYTNNDLRLSSTDVRDHLYKSNNSPLHREPSNPYTKNFNYDNFGSSTNAGHENWPNGRTGKKKSISTQNISFGGQDHKTVVDHLADASNVESVVQPTEHPMPSRKFSSASNEKRHQENVTPENEYSNTEYSQNTEYLTPVSEKSFQEQQDASNNNFQVVEAPTENFAEIATTQLPTNYYIEEQTTQRSTSTEAHNQPFYTYKKAKKSNFGREQEIVNIRPKEKTIYNGYKKNVGDRHSRTNDARPVSIVNKSTGLERTHQKVHHDPQRTVTDDSELGVRGKLKYGDKLQERLEMGIETSV